MEGWGDTSDSCPLEGHLVEDTLYRTDRILTMSTVFKFHLESCTANETHPVLMGTGLPVAFGLVSPSKSFLTGPLSTNTRVVHRIRVGGWWVSKLPCAGVGPFLVFGDDISDSGFCVLGIFISLVAGNVRAAK